MAGGIVCGIDDSSGARRAVTVALRLATDLGRPLMLVHVAGGASRFPYGDDARRERRRHAIWRHGHALIADVRGRYRVETEIQERIEAGDSAVQLARAADEEQAELLVVGSRGRGPLRSALLGSVSDSLECLAPCPLVVAPPGAPASQGQRPEHEETIVCGIADPESQSDLVEFSAGLAGAVRARLEVVHADSGDGWNGAPLTPAMAEFWSEGDVDRGDPALLRLETAMHLAEAHGVRADARLAPGPPALALERVAQREGGRLIVIGSRRSGRLRSLLRGSVSRELAKFGSTPVVVVPQRGVDGGDEGQPLQETERPDTGSEAEPEPYGILR